MPSSRPRGPWLERHRAVNCFRADTRRHGMVDLLASGARGSARGREIDSGLSWLHASEGRRSTANHGNFDIRMQVDSPGDESDESDEKSPLLRPSAP